MTAFLTGAEALARNVTQGAARIPRATQMGGDGVVQLGAGPLQAVDVSTGACRSASEPAEIMVVAVGDALEREGALTGGAHPPASAGLVGVHGDHHAIGRWPLTTPVHVPVRGPPGGAARALDAAPAQIAATAKGASRRSRAMTESDVSRLTELKIPLGEKTYAWELGGPYLSEVQSGGLALLDGSGCDCQCTCEAAERAKASAAPVFGNRSPEVLADPADYDRFYETSGRYHADRGLSSCGSLLLSRRLQAGGEHEFGSVDDGVSQHRSVCDLRTVVAEVSPRRKPTALATVLHWSGSARLRQRAGMTPERVSAHLSPSCNQAPSTASDEDRSRYASTWASRSRAFCSTVATASAPATQRTGGCSRSTTVSRALASLAGSLVCFAAHRFPRWAGLGGALGIVVDRQVGVGGGLLREQIGAEEPWLDDRGMDAERFDLEPQRLHPSLQAELRSGVG